MADLFAASIELREYQQRAIRDVLSAFETGARSPLLVLPTGAGKTTVAAALMQREIAAEGAALFLAPRRELVQQAARRLRDAGIEAGTLLAGAEHLAAPDARAQVASIDTLLARSRHGRSVELPSFTLVLIDEAHLAITERRTALLLQWPHARRLGLTATPIRKDGRALGALFDRLIEPVTVAELQATGYLAPARYWAPSAPDLERVRITAGDYNGKDLEAAVNRADLVGDVVAHWLRLASDRSTVVFAASIPHSLALCEQFQRSGVAAEHVDANTPVAERDAILERFKRGSTKVLTNCLLASYGFDFPSLSAVVLARPTRSLMLYLQTVGRGLRAAQGKRDCVVLDHAGCVSLHGFAEDPRVWSLDGRGLGAESKRTAVRRDPTDAKTLTCPECFAIFQRAIVCPECGYRFRPAPRDLRALDVNLVEVGKHDADATNRERFYRELRGIAVERRYSPKWPAVQFRERFGMWPPHSWSEGRAIEPSTATRRWVQSRLIAFAKARADRPS